MDRGLYETPALSYAAADIKPSEVREYKRISVRPLSVVHFGGALETPLNQRPLRVFR